MVGHVTIGTNDFQRAAAFYDALLTELGMIALVASSQEQVDKIHAKALALGGTDEGKPGPRGDGFYGGYFRDLDGNKLNAYFMA